MTEEEKIICKQFLNDADKTHSCNEYKLLMQLLEQEPILDKIRAEIMTLRNIRAEHFDIESNVFDDRLLLRSDVLDIFDKYKAEIEP